MNWYKKSQYEYDDIPEWDYPDATHDYNPSWDYDIDTKIEKEISIFVENFIQEIKNNIFPEIGFLENIKIAYVKDNNDILAKYIDGTQPYVVIVLNINAIKNGVKKFGGSIQTQIEMTILHELGHAIQDAMNFEYDESDAEEFAFQYEHYNNIFNFWD